MTHAETLSRRYDRAAPGWGDKMRVLGYADAYLGFLASDRARVGATDTVCDIGCGTGAFAQAWLGIHGAQSQLTLLDPSRAMLDRAEAALSRQGGRPRMIAAGLDGLAPDQPFDHILAAHVIEHLPDPAEALRRMRACTGPGGHLWLIASKPHWCNAIIWLNWRHRAFTAARIAGLLDATGWRLSTTYAFPSGPPSRTSLGYIAQAA